MALKIKQDQSRFKSIVRGKIRQNLRKYISNGDLMGGYGGDKISVPLPQIDLPKFTFDHRDKGGVGQGPASQVISLRLGMSMKVQGRVKALARTQGSIHLRLM